MIFLQDISIFKNYPGKILLYLGVILILIIGCKGSTEPEGEKIGDLEVTVVDSGGLPVIANVNIISLGKTGTTDAIGKVLFNEIKEGKYEIVAYKQSYGSKRTEVNVTGGTLNKILIIIPYGTIIEPGITIIEPSRYGENKTSVGDTVKFVLSLTDDVTAKNKINVQLVSNQDGKIFEGYPGTDGKVTFKTAALSKNQHIIRITATDEDGFLRKDSIVVKNIKPKKVTVSANVGTGLGVNIAWSIYADTDFSKYEIYQTGTRTWDPYGYAGNLVTTITDKNTVAFNDMNPTVTDSTFYRVRVYSQNNEFSESNVVRVNNPAGLIYTYTYKESVMHPTLPYIYMITFDKKLLVYNCETKSFIKNVSLNSEPGQIIIGNNGYGIELYVSDRDGYISVYDPVELSRTLYLSARTAIYGLDIDNAGKIFAFCNDNTMRIFNRGTGALISEYKNGSIYKGRIDVLPGKKEIYIISIGISPVDMDLLLYDQNSNITKWVNDNQHGNYALDPFIMKTSPNEEYMITSYMGAVYQMDEAMNFLGYLPRGSAQYSDFIITDAGDEIWASSTTTKEIVVIRYSDKNILKKYQTVGLPIRLFKTGNKIYCISKANSNIEYYREYDLHSSFKFIIEEININ